VAWRSVVISQPARLSLVRGAMQIEQELGTAKVPLEDISVLVIDQPQVSITSQLLSQLAAQQIATITVGEDHCPNGVLLPFLPHSRALKIMQAQLALSVPMQKRLWQIIVKQKVFNQAQVLESYAHEEAQTLRLLASRVRSGDTDNIEAQAAKRYFSVVFGKGFIRTQARFYNACINYGYACIRAAIARSLCVYGFLPAFGLHHRSELNSFNLADDLIEPFRALLDAYVLQHFPQELSEDLTPTHKSVLVSILHQDISTTQHAKGAACTVLAAIDAMVISLSQIIQNPETENLALVLPYVTKTPPQTAELFTDDEAF
jgi:CRISPR-associated protein Cas1